jgi:ABC-2 type transport system ATP-binding protein
LEDIAIRLTGVSKSFGPTTAVESLDLTVPTGSIYGLLGPNGAGKTTTIRMILDILGPDSGTVEVLGRRIDDALRCRIGYLPEERGLYQRMTVIDQLVFLAVLKGMARSEARSEAMSWLERFELGDRADSHLEELSKGMQQKVQFIGTILHHPDILILDEPFSGLDPINVDLLKRMVLEHHESGTTILFSTHMIEDAEQLCDRVCMIAGARKVLDGSVSEVRASTGRRDVVLRFHGEPSFLRDAGVEGKVERHGDAYELTLADGADSGELLRRAVGAGVQVDRFEVREPTLREIFLERAGKRGLDTSGAERVEPASMGGLR